eukprot:sb/3477826/
MTTWMRSENRSQLYTVLSLNSLRHRLIKRDQVTPNYSKRWVVTGGTGIKLLCKTTNQNSLFKSRDWLSANQGPVFPDSVDGDGTGIEILCTALTAPATSNLPTEM